MGATLSTTNSRSDIKNDELKLRELSVDAVAKIKSAFGRNPTNSQIDKRQLCNSFHIGEREANILFDYFDMDGNGQIDNYELTCALAMVVHSSVELRAEFLFRLYDFDMNNYLTRDELIHLVRTITAYKNKPLISSEIETKVDNIIAEADFDMDKKLSLQEFQSYVNKKRDVLNMFDAYSKLLTMNPMSVRKRGVTQSVSERKGGAKRKKKEEVVREHDDDDEVEEDEKLHEEDEGGNEDDDNNYNDENENEDEVNMGNVDDDEYEEEGMFEEEEDVQGDEMDPDLYEELQKDSTAKERTEEKQNIKKGVEFANGFMEEEEVQGDEFGAVKPWLTNVVNTVPSSYKPSKLDGALPDAQLELEFVHGYRCHDTRNNLRYTADGEIVYHTAAIGIVYNKDEHKQRFYNEHFDDITALAIHPDRNIVATGEMGPYPLISIWNIETNEALVHIREPLTKGINHLAFSKDGKYLVATAADDAHNVAVFDWEKGVAEDLSTIQDHRLRTKKNQAQCKGPVVGTCEGGRANILGVCFNKDATNIALACVKEVNIITVSKGKMKKKKATGLKGDNLTSIMCCGYLGNNLLCGTMKGKLLVCAGTQFTKTIKAHTSSMNSLFIRENDNGFITGGSDGMVITWNKKYAKVSTISIKSEEIRSLCPRVRSIDEDVNGNILIGTRGGEILEINGDTPVVYLRGHWDKELWGLCVHPQKDMYYTVGEDKLLGVWDIQTMKLKQWSILEEEATSIDISPNGKELAIGCESGNFYIYEASTLKKKLKKKETVTKAVEEVKYSPCGNYLAVGGIDKDTDGFMHIFIFDVKNNYKRYKKMKGHQSRITHIDWSSDSDFIQSNSQAYELLYHSTSSGAQITKITSMRDIEWHTWTCVLGWPVQGIWPECASGDDINACDIDKTKRYIVTSDDYSKVKLFRYPSPVERAAFLQYNGHSSHVTCVRFLSDNKHVISIGGLDKAVFQFKFTTNDEAANEAEEMAEIDEEEANPDDDEQETYFKEEEIMEGTEFGASKPWIGELQASSPKIKVNKNAGKAPTQNIKRLKYVFGYRAFDTRMNIKYTADENKIVYHTAALGIVLDKTTNTQTYFTNHEEDIVSLAIHPNGTTVATGQMAAKGKAKLIDLYVWNINNLPDETNVLADDRAHPPKGVTNLKGALLRAIRIVQFSPDGKRLLANGQDDYNSVAVYDTSNLNKITLIGTVKVDGARVLDACWKNNNEFVTVGPKHIKFFKVSGRNITQSKGVYGKVKVEPLVSAAFAFNKLFTGTDKGNLITWEGSNASSVKTICKNGPLYTLYYYAKDKILFSGGYDGIIIAYKDAKLNEQYRIDMRKITNSPCDCGIRSIDCNDKREMLVGTKGGEIVEISLESKTLLRTLMNSHYDSELWAVAINPTNNYEVASGGGDKTLRIWDIRRNRQKKIMTFPEDFRAIDWSSDGKFIIVGTMPGLIYYVDVKRWEKSSAFKSIFYSDAKTKAKQNSDKDKWIQELKISPSNEYVAFGSHCGISSSFSKIQVLKITPSNTTNPLKQYVTVDPKITSALTHLDWSTDNDRIVCNSLAFELKHVSIGAKSVVKASSCVYEDDLWHTWTCLFGYPVQGIWPPDSTGYIVNYTCMSNNKQVIATGDDFSLVKLFRSPCVVEHASYKAYGGHSSHIPKVRFTPNDRFLISVGGNDKSVFVWETDFGVGGDDDNEEEEVVEEEEEEEKVVPKNKNKSNTKKRREEVEDDWEDDDREYKEEMEKSKKEQQIKRNKKGNKKAVIHEEEEEEDENENRKQQQQQRRRQQQEINTNKNRKQQKQQPKPQTKQRQRQQKVEEEEIEEEEEHFDDNEAEAEDEQEIEENEHNNDNEVDHEIQGEDYHIEVNDQEGEGEGEEEIFEEDNFDHDTDKRRTHSKQKSNNKSSTKKKASTGNNKAVFAMEASFNADNAAAIDNPFENSQLNKASNIIDDDYQYISSEPLNVSLKLDYVFGVRTKDNRNNVRYITPSLIVYHSSSLGIVHDLQTNKQQFFTQHTNEITAFNLNKQRLYAVTADGPSQTTNTYVHIWNVNDCKSIAQIKLPIKEGVSYAAFSPNSEFVACAGLDSDCTVFIIDIQQGSILCQHKANIKKIFGIAFSTEREFATVGIRHMKFWTIEEDNTLSFVEGNLVDNENDKFGSIVSDGSKYYVSTQNGSICIWENKEFVSSKLIHSKAIDALFLNDNVLVSGGRDRTVVIMNKELNELNHFEIDGISFNSADPSPRSIDIYGNTTDKILIGTIASDIVEVEFKNGNYLSEPTRNKCYLNAHFSATSKTNNQVTGIAYFKPRNIFITTGEDSSMRFWSASHNKHEDVLAFEHKPCALTISPNHKHIIAGFESGKIQVYDGKDFENPQEFITYSNKPITALQVSPNNKYLACACVNKNNKHEIIIYKEENEQYEVYTTFTEHNDEVIAIDWTKNSNYIACSSLQGEVTIYDINKQTKVEDGSVNNSDWVSWTQTSGWALNGYYESGNAHVTACMRSENKVAGHNVIAVGNEDGVVRLYNYPIVSSSQAHIEGDIKHVGKVKRVCFDEESKVVFTAGEEGILFKWVLEEEMSNH